MNDDYSTNDDFSTVKKYKIATIVLAIIVLILGFYIIVDKAKENSSGKPSDKKSNEEQSSSFSEIESSSISEISDDDSSSSSDKLIKIDLSRIQEYLSIFLNLYSDQTISFSDDKTNLFGYLYSKEKLELTDFNNDAILRGSATVLFQTTRKNTPASTIIIPQSELEQTITDIFGPNIEVTHQSFKYRHGDFVFDGVKKEYTVIYDNSTTTKGDYFAHKIMSQKRIKNQYEVIINAGYVNTTETDILLYKEYPGSEKNLIGPVVDKVTSEQYDKLNSYKFLFNINEIGSINFISVSKSNNKE